MAPSAFLDKSVPPEPATLSAELGQAADLWGRLIADVSAAYPPITEAWNYGGVKHGWSLRLKRGDRILLYLTPMAGSFRLGVVLGEKAAKAAHDQRLPEAVLKLIDDAPRYAEGRGIRMVVSTRDDVAAAAMFAALKMTK